MPLLLPRSLSHDNRSHQHSEKHKSLNRSDSSPMPKLSAPETRLPGILKPSSSNTLSSIDSSTAGRRYSNISSSSDNSTVNFTNTNVFDDAISREEPVVDSKSSKNLQSASSPPYTSLIHSQVADEQQQIEGQQQKQQQKQAIEQPFDRVSSAHILGDTKVFFGEPNKLQEAVKRRERVSVNEEQRINELRSNINTKDTSSEISHKRTGILVKKISMTDPSFDAERRGSLIQRSDTTKSALKTRKLSTPEKYLTDGRSYCTDLDKRNISTISLNTNNNETTLSRRVPCISSDYGIRSIPMQSDVSFELSSKLPTSDSDVDKDNKFLETPLSDSLSQLLLVPSNQNCASSTTSMDVISSQRIRSGVGSGSNDGNVAVVQRKRRLPVRLTIPVPGTNTFDSSSPMARQLPPNISAGIILGLDDMKPASPSVVTFSQTPSVISNYTRNGKLF